MREYRRASANFDEQGGDSTRAYVPSYRELETTCAPLSQARYACNGCGGGRLNRMRGQLSQPAIGRDRETATGRVA